jgi:hypothetical protein
MTIRKDRRTPEQQKTHRWLVTATNRFLSGWGLAHGGLSKCAWACRTHEQALAKYDEIKKRGDMKYVRIINGDWYPRNAVHVSIYVVANDTEE